MKIATGSDCETGGSSFHVKHQQIWNDTIRIVSRIIDGHGMPIDSGIKETVAVLQLLGFNTIASCEGHAGWGHPYPWVKVNNVQALIDESSISDVSYLSGRLRIIDGLSISDEHLNAVIRRTNIQPIPALVNRVLIRQETMRQFTEFLKTKWVRL